MALAISLSFAAFFFSLSDESPRLELLTEFFLAEADCLLVGADDETEPDELEELLLLSSTILFWFDILDLVTVSVFFTGMDPALALVI